MLKLFFRICLFLLSACPLHQAEASQLQQTDKVAVQFIYKNEGINPEENVEFIVKFLLKDGWHIFSNTPGEIAMPTAVEWKLPEGYQILKEQWTIGKDFENDGIIQNGYDSIAYYKAVMKPSPDIWRDVHFKARVSWLACREECVPESLRFEFSLPVIHADLAYSPLWEGENALALQSFEMMPMPAAETARLPWMMLLAFAGGIILNLMPCIFPILSIKAISLAQGSTDKKKARVEALLYLLGVVSCFMITASVLIWLRSKGEQIGWGFQLQSPVFVGLMIVIFSVILLMFLDIIQIRIPGINAIGKFSAGTKNLSSFLTGFFAVLIASPCTAPFMGAAVGYTLTQPATVFYAVFLSLSLGYALPFTIIACFPKFVHKLLPKPGKWMDILKKIFAIPIFLTCIWLAWVLQNQLRPAADISKDISWNAFNREEIEGLLNEHKPVFIDFTAKWCITCLANEKLALSSSEFQELVHKKQIHLFKGDWTNNNEEISKALESFGRQSVPLYIYYDGTGGYKVLPQLLTPGSVKEYLE